MPQRITPQPVLQRARIALSHAALAKQDARRLFENVVGKTEVERALLSKTEEIE
jgi:hypothetical protein